MSTIKREMTPEIQEKLKGLLPTSNSVGISFTPEVFKRDPDLKQYAPIYKQRGFIESERIEIETLESSFDIEKATNQEFNKLNNDLIEIGRKTIVDFDILDIATGNKIEFKKDEDGFLSEILWGSIPKTQRLEIYKNACVISGLKEKTTLKQEKEQLEKRLVEINKIFGDDKSDFNEIQEGLES